MGEDTQGLVGDRRRNPFPSMNDTEYQLLLLTIREAVNQGVSQAMSRYQRDNCAPHQEDTQKLKKVVFGASEDGFVGLDDRMLSVERSLAYAGRSLWIAIGAVIVALVSLLADNVLR